MKFKTIVAFFVVALIVVFSIQNSEITELELFIWKISMSRALIILGSFAIGVLVGILISMKKKRINY